MPRRHLLLVVLLLVVASAIAAWLVLRTNDDGSVSAPIASDDVDSEPDDRALDDWLGPDERAPRTRPRHAGAPDDEPRGERRRREWRPDGGNDDGRRERFRARFLERVEVLSLGPTVTTLRPEDVADVLRESRRPMRACVRQSGVDRSIWRGIRRVEREIVFDVAPDGRVVPSSFGANPPLPDVLTRCFAQALERTPLPAAGAEGARVSVVLPTSRRAGDGGVRGSRRRPNRERP